MTFKTLFMAATALAAPLTLVHPSLAQDVAEDAETTSLDQIVVTAGRSSNEVGTLAQSVVVIDREQIEDRSFGSSDVAEVIARFVPGLAPSNQTLSGASQTFRGRNLLVMVDGVPRNTPLRDVSRILSLIDLSTVERIEVVNGASGLYGAGATGGTINIITRRAVEDGVRTTITTQASAFTHNPADSLAPSASARVEGRKGAFDYVLSLAGDLSRTTYDGKGREMASDGMLGQGGGDRTGNTDLFAAVGYEEGSRRYDLSLDWTYLEQNPDWLTNYATSPVSPDYASPYTGEPLKEDSWYLTGTFTEDDFALGSLEVKSFYNAIEKQAPFNSLSAVNSIVYYSGIPASPTAPENQSVLTSDRAGLNATVNSATDWLREGASLTWGVDYTFDHTIQELVNGTTIISPMTQHQIAGFGQLEVPVTDRLVVQGGARFDQFFLDVDDFRRPAAVQYRSPTTYTLYPAIDVTGGSFSYNSPTFNLGAVFDLTEESQAFANFSQGYSLTDIGGFTRRAGVNSVSEICTAYGALASAYGCTGAPTFAINYASIAPDPQLVNTYEAGVRGDWTRFRGSASAYVSTSENGVNFDATSNRVSQQKELIWGVEATAEADVLDMLTIGGIFSYVEGKYDADGDGKIESGEYLPNNRIPNNYKLNLYGELRFLQDMTARAEVEYFSGRDVTTQDLPDVTLVNFGLSKEFGESSKLSLGVRNVFDTSYVNPVASAVRGADVPGLGRTIALTYRATF